MARTKKLELPDPSTQVKIEDVPVPPNWSPSQPQQRRPAQPPPYQNDDADSDDEDMNDARLSLGPFEASTNRLRSNPNMAIYYQNPLSQAANPDKLWCLPPVLVDMNIKKFKQEVSDDPVAVFYYKSYHLIRKNWNIRPEECIPESLRNQTPYSMTLIFLLRRFSSHTKQDSSFAQSQLLDARRKRLNSGLNSGEHNGAQWVDTHVLSTITRANAHAYNVCESKVLENYFGLMLVDVDFALRNAKKQRKARAAAKNPNKQEKQQKKKADRVHNPSEVAEKVVQRRRDQKSNRFAAIQDDEPEHQDQHDVSNEGNQVRNNRQHRHEDNNMSFLMNKAGLEHRGKARKKKAQHWSAGGHSRKNVGSYTMPSERGNMNSLSTLHEMAASTSTADLANMGQQPLPSWSGELAFR